MIYLGSSETGSNVKRYFDLNKVSRWGISNNDGGPNGQATPNNANERWSSNVWAGFCPYRIPIRPSISNVYTKIFQIFEKFIFLLTTKPDVLSSKHRKRTVNVLCNKWSCSTRENSPLKSSFQLIRISPEFVKICSKVKAWCSLVNFSFHCKCLLNSSRSSEWINSYALWWSISD
jgi:hypothetical protein